jgi:hypothetical protein
MSGIEVHPGVYSKIRAYAELVDRVLGELRRGHVSDTGVQRLRLSSLLMAVGDGERISADAKLLEWMLREGGCPSPKRLNEMGHQLDSGDSSPELLIDLESLAKTLERERASAFARMRGR